MLMLAGHRQAAATPVADGAARRPREVQSALRALQGGDRRLAGLHPLV